MLLLCLPENKGGEDYTWISSLFMVRSNPLQSLVWLSSSKSLRLRTAGMQPPCCGPNGEHVPGGYLPGQWWHCLWPPPEDPCHELGTAFCWRFLPLLQEGKERHGVIWHIHPKQLGAKRYVWVAGWKQDKRAGLWGPAEGLWGFNFLMLRITGWADVAVKDSSGNATFAGAGPKPPPTCTSTCLAHAPNPSPPAVIGPMGKGLNPFFFKPLHWASFRDPYRALQEQLAPSGP